MLKNRTLLGFLVSWLSGILLGTLFAAGADDSLLSLMRLAVCGRVSIFALLLFAVLPLLIAAYAVYINRFEILYVMGLVKGISYSFCACMIMRAFGSAGWLVQPMAQFTDAVMCGVFCLFCIRRCGPREHDVKTDLAVCFAVCAMAATIDYLLVSRFLAALI